jgi:hypothetical protein
MQWWIKQRRYTQRKVFSMPTGIEILTRWLLSVIQTESFGMSPLGIQGEGKIGTTGRTVWSGLFDAVPDLTNRVESIFADTEGNVCAEVVLSGTLAKEFAGMMSPNRYYALPHVFILKIYGEETRIQRIVAYWDLPKV